MKIEATYDFNIEASLLCTLIYDPSISTFHIEPELFVHTYHKQIFQAIVALDQQSIARDEITIRDYLVSKMRVSPHDTETTLANILIFTPSASPAHFISRLREIKKIRDIRTALINVQEGIDNGKSANELEAALLYFGQKIASNNSLELFTMHQASVLEAKEPEFICKDFIPIPKKTVTIFSAGGGTGKTFLIIQLAMRYLVENPAEKAFLWLSEDAIGIAKERINEISNNVYTQGINTHNRLFISADPTFHAIHEENRSITSNPLLHKMKIKLKDTKFIVLDPLIAFYGGDENNNSHARQFMQLFTQWAAEEDKIIIFIHHSTKNTTQSRGASALVDASRAVYEVDKIKDSDGNETSSTKRIVSLTKDNYRASKYFGGYKKEVVIFPSETIVKKPKVIEYLSIDDELGIS